MAAIHVEGFENIEPLGSGGLGDVYRATRTSTRGQVAIKVLRDWTDRDLAWERAQRELRALVDLRGHSNVVNVEEVIESDGQLSIVMEFAPGGSVHDLMQREGGRLDVGSTLLIATHTASALAAAHDRGIIHRDIKPHNLLIGAFGQVKVCDFGIASLTRSESVRDRTSSLSLRYASPEELRGEQDVGTAADIYSLAATLHQLLTGQYLPLPDGTAGSIPLRTWNAPDDLPADVELDVRSLVVRCGDRRPSARPSAAELHERFEELAGRLGPSRVRRLPLVAADPGDATAAAPSAPVPAAPVLPAAAPTPPPTSPPAPPSTPPPTGSSAPADAPGVDDAAGATVIRPGAAAAAASSGSTGTAGDATSAMSGGAAGADATSAMYGAAGGPPGSPPGGPLLDDGYGDDDRSSGRTALAIFGVLAVLLIGGVAAFGLGLFGGDGDDASASTTVPGSSTPSDTSSTTTASVTTIATDPTTTTTESPATTAVPDETTTTTTTTTVAPTTPPPTAPPTTTIPPGYDEQQCPGIGACIAMSRISIEDGGYLIRWNGSFEPSVAGDHAHFFWDIHRPDQVGSASVDQAPWELTDDRAFVPTDEMRLGNRPDGATGICVTAADADHAVIDPSFYHCVYIPVENEEIALEAVAAGLEIAELWPDLLD